MDEATEDFVEPPLRDWNDTAREGFERRREEALQRKAARSKRVEPERVEPERVASNGTDDLWTGWNAWLSDGVTTHIEAEREFQRDVLSEVLARLCADVRKELRKETETEVKVLNARLDALRDAIAGVQKREHSESNGVHKELRASAVEVNELRGQLSRLSEAVQPLLDHFAGVIEDWRRERR
jgi:hypothetical protein